MPVLTPAQIAVLRADILAAPDTQAIPNNPDGDVAIAALYNAAASPSWTIWRTQVPVAEIMNEGFVWTSVDGLTAGKARIWEWMTRLGEINPSKANIRQGLQDAFGNGTAMANAITPTLKKLATRAQKLFSTGTGSSGSPATLDANIHESFVLSQQDIEIARRG